jgi:hypothetical protein
MANQEAAGLFLEAWIPELAKSVEMFTGTTVKIEPGDNAPVDQLLTSVDSVTWLKQVLEGGASGALWIGTPGTTCVSLTEGSADDADGRESLLKEMLLQSLAGAAHLLSSGRDPKIVCGEGNDSGSPPDMSRLQAIWLVGPKQERMPLFLSLDSDLLDLLAVEEPSMPALEVRPQKAHQSSVARLGTSGGSGARKIEAPIRELIKLTPGSRSSSTAVASGGHRGPQRRGRQGRSGFHRRQLWRENSRSHQPQ